MKKKEKEPIPYGMIFAIVVSVLLVGILFYGSETEVVGEIPCVDGRNRVNLEGFMCEDIEKTWYGFYEGFAVLILIPFFLILLIGVFFDKKREDIWKEKNG